MKYIKILVLLICLSLLVAVIVLALRDYQNEKPNHKIPIISIDTTVGIDTGVLLSANKIVVRREADGNITAILGDSEDRFKPYWSEQIQDSIIYIQSSETGATIPVAKSSIRAHNIGERFEVGHQLKKVVLIVDGKVVPIVGDTINVTTCKYGCKDKPKKKRIDGRGLLNFDTASYLISESADTLFLKDVKFYEVLIQGNSSQARRDTSGRWEIFGRCDSLLEVLYREWLRK